MSRGAPAFFLVAVVAIISWVAYRTGWIHPGPPPPGMVLVPAGSFLMGDPPANAWLPAYYIDRTEVSNQQFSDFVQATHYKAEGTWPLYATPGRERYPVVRVTWNDARAYAAWANKRLPTEAEWEKAARGTDGRRYPWGNDWQDGRANCLGTDAEPVDSRPQGASPYGALHMADNVFEWTENSLPPGKFERRVIRGGCWLYVPEAAQCTFRYHNLPFRPSHLVGFRCVRSL